MFEVVLAVVGPQAAVVETEHVVSPVGQAGDTGWPDVRRSAPVVPPVRRAAPYGVTRQHLGTSTVIATLLTRSVFRTGAKT